MKNMIEFFDDKGQKILIPHTTYRDEVLPHNLQNHWDKPDELASTIMTALTDGFYSEVEEAAKHLVDIDSTPERAICLYGSVLLQTGQYYEAEQCFLNYLNDHPKAHYVLTNLAKAQDFLEKKAESLGTLEESISIDPNQENALDWWRIIKIEEFESQGLSHEQAQLSALEQANKRFGGWKCQLWLGDYYAEAHDKKTARKYYETVLKEDWTPDALTSISGNLGKNGFAEDAVELVAPFYVPHQHDVMTGFNLLQAYLELKQISEGQILLKKMFDLQHPGLQEQLSWYQTEFFKVLNSLQKSSNDHLNITSISLDFPLWCYGWNIKHGLESAKTGKKIALFQLAWELDQQINKITVDIENTGGRLARAIPLFLQEAIYYWTDASATCMFSLNNDTGDYILYNHVPSSKQIINLSKQGYDGVVTGTIASDELKITYWDLTTGSPNHQNFMFKLNNPAETMSHIERFIFKTSKISYGSSFKHDKKNFQRIPLDSLNEYLMWLSQHLTLYIATQYPFVAKKMHGEQDIINKLLKLTMNTPTLLQAQLNMLSAIHKCMSYNSTVITNYKNDILKWLNKLIESPSPLKGMAKKTSHVFEKYCE